MTGRRAVVGLCMLCAFSFGAIAAQSVSAATNGTTAFTCKKKAVEGGAGFSKEHCKSEDAVASGAKYEHAEVPANTKTEFTVVNESTGGVKVPAKIKTVLAGIEFELQATGTHAEGWTINEVNPETGEHFIHGEGATTYSGVTVTKPAGKGCKVKEGELKTATLKGTSAGQGMEGKLEPAVGTEFASVTIEGCMNAALNGIKQITGSIKCPGDGSTVLCTHAATTTLGTLKFAGQKAGVEVTTTAKGKAAGDPGFTALAVTTVETK